MDLLELTTVESVASRPVPSRECPRHRRSHGSAAAAPALSQPCLIKHAHRPSKARIRGRSRRKPVENPLFQSSSSRFCHYNLLKSPPNLRRSLLRGTPQNAPVASVQKAKGRPSCESSTSILVPVLPHFHVQELMLSPKNRSNKSKCLPANTGSDSKIWRFSFKLVSLHASRPCAEKQS